MFQYYSCCSTHDGGCYYCCCCADFNLDSLLWPKLLGFAERLWSSRLAECAPGGAPPDQSPQQCNLTQTKVVERAHALRCRLVARGVAASPIRAHWCDERDMPCPDELRWCRGEWL